MAIAVEHDQRRKKILEKALAVFMDDGFENATFQKIADRCGITRTILYLYFKNKKEIFTYSIKQLLLSVEENIKLIISNKSLCSIEKITNVFLVIFSLLEKNRPLLSVVLDYLLHIAKSGTNPEELVRRRTVKLRHFLSTMLIEGIKSEELKKTDVKISTDYLYSFVESAIFQLVVLKRENLSELNNTIKFAIKHLEKDQ
ncbi:MAG: TetR/AcrR family transcriptional regulator [Treponema sp.]|nr:TetR/AcrR family transcriptional regulator [Treponema sp.]MCL2251037.1 TetR/AcrR family transcriptional regulator [Treponema sp.]